MEEISVNIRRAQLSDIPAIRAIAAEAFPATYASILTQEQIDYMMEWMYSTKALEKDFEEGITFLLLYWGDSPAGYISFGPEERNRWLFHLHKIYLLPASQGCGLGRTLFERALDEMRKAGASAVELNVNRYNKALHFYQKMGMHIERSGDFPIGKGYFMNDHIMRIEL